MLFIILLIIALIVIYLFLIFPSRRKPDCSRILGWNYAHRGIHDNVTGPPENTIAAFENAVIMGFGIELDVRLSKDNVLVVHHDETLRRTCGDDTAVSACTAKQLSAQMLFGQDYGIPTLSKALKVIDGQVPIIIEIKEESCKSDTVIALREVLMNYSGAYCIQSFNPVQLMHLRRLMPEAVRGQLSTDFKRDRIKRSRVFAFFASNLLFNFLSRPHFISYGYRYHNKTGLRICKSLCAFTAGWTPKSVAAVKRTLKHFSVAIFENCIPENIKR